MTSILQVGSRQIVAEELISLLAGYQLLPQLIQELIIDQAISTISLNAEEIEQALQHYERRHQTTQQAWLEQTGMTIEQWEHFATRSYKLEKFKQATWGDQLEAYFLERKPQLDRVIYSLIRTHDSGIAQEIFFRLQAQEQSFAELAREYSEGTEAQTGGLIGPIEASTLHPVIAKLLATSQAQQIHPPTRLGEWFIILRLEKFISIEFDAALRQRLLEERFMQWMRQQLQSLNFSITQTPSAVAS
jgi:parvulin-like peptidyl-prolyl isomerase